MKPGPKPKPIEERFWAKVEKTEGCWLWVGRVDGKGYGVIHREGSGTRIGAHRYSWELHHGPVPTGLYVLHHCDVPLCVHPEHLHIGDQFENMADAMLRGRVSHAPKPTIQGMRHWNARFTDEQVAAIRAMQGRASSRAVARIFGTSHANVQRIWHGARQAAPSPST